MNADKLLLDTHAFLWWRMDEPRLNASARAAIAHAELVYVSAASAWEIGIKTALGKLRLQGRLEEGVRDSGFLPLPIAFAHAEAAALLPAHHRDPFDRMLVAQALVERLTLVTHNEQLRPYGVATLWT